MVNQKEEICTDIGKAMGTFLRITSYGRPQGEVSKAVRAYFRNVEIFAAVSEATAMYPVFPQPPG